MPTPGKIETFHKKLITSVKNVIGWDIEISPSCPEWKGVKATAQILWTALPGGTTPVEQAYRNQRDRVCVFSVEEGADETDPRGWVTWSEIWGKNKQREFYLLSAGWTAFWGSPSDDQKVQVLRADWDQPNPDIPARRESEAGQPHWHVDRVIPVQDSWAIPQAAPRIEGELPSIMLDDEVSLSRTIPAIRMGKVHLSMGTWEGAAYPRCWQRSYDDDCDKLLDWAGKTLQYLKGQLGSKRDLVHFEDIPSPT
jgi:hypothetical protein